MSDDDHASTLAAETGSVVIGDRYELLGLLGSGGMGNVYKVRDRELDEIVALKVLRPELLAGTQALDRFRREVKLARRVTHPNVARVFDIGEAGTDRFLTMEFVDGESLGALLRREGRFSLTRAIRIARAIGSGLAAAHEAGVVHRDIKPENVLIATDGRVVVTDFGIARGAADPGRTVGLVGTPAYMAPEQIDERSTVDHRADVYAFGVLLYELLTGERAWQAESIWALAAARLTEAPPDPRSRCPELPESLAKIVLGCMAREPEARTASMVEVEAALAQIVVVEPSGAIPLTSPVPAAPLANPSAASTGASKRVTPRLILQLRNQEHGFGLATYRSLIVVVWGRTVTLADIQALTKVQHELVDSYGHFAVVTIIRAGLLMSVDDEVRRLSESNLREFQGFNRGNAMVVEAGGLRASFFRSVLTGIQLLARSPVPLKVFDNIDEAIQWVLDRPGLDPVLVDAIDPILAAAFELADRFGAVGPTRP